MSYCNHIVAIHYSDHCILTSKSATDSISTLCLHDSYRAMENILLFVHVTNFYSYFLQQILFNKKIAKY